MSLLDLQSTECLKSELELFTVPGTVYTLLCLLKYFAPSNGYRCCTLDYMQLNDTTLAGWRQLINNSVG